MGEADQEMPRYFLGSRIVGSDCEVPVIGLVTSKERLCMERFSNVSAVESKPATFFV